MSTRVKEARPNVNGGANISYTNHPLVVSIMYNKKLHSIRNNMHASPYMHLKVVMTRKPDVHIRQ